MQDQLKTPEGVHIVCERDSIKHWEASLREFFADILGMDYDAALVTDDACLSDFAFSGAWRMPELPGVTLPNLYRMWNKWVIERICSRYGLEPGSFKTRIPLIALMARIQERAQQHLH